MDTVIRAAGQLGLEVIPTGDQPAEVILPIVKELSLTEKYRKAIEGGSGRLLLVVAQEGWVAAVWDSDDNKGGIPGHIGHNGGKLAQAVASIDADSLFDAEQWTKIKHEVTRDGTINSLYKENQQHGSDQGSDQTNRQGVL